MRAPRDRGNETEFHVLFSWLRGLSCRAHRAYARSEPSPSMRTAGAVSESIRRSDGLHCPRRRTRKMPRDGKPRSAKRKQTPAHIPKKPRSTRGFFSTH